MPTKKWRTEKKTCLIFQRPFQDTFLEHVLVDEEQGRGELNDLDAGHFFGRSMLANVQINFRIRDLTEKTQFRMIKAHDNGEDGKDGATHQTVVDAEADHTQEGDHPNHLIGEKQDQLFITKRQLVPTARTNHLRLHIWTV